MTKTAGIIKKKLGTKSLKELITDDEFRNSIFHRFAVLKLPLRKGLIKYQIIHINFIYFRGHFLGRTGVSQESGKEEYSDYGQRHKISSERAEHRVRSRPGIGGKSDETGSGEKAAK